MRILGARIFSKSFGGKIQPFLNNQSMRDTNTRIFSKFFGGKNKMF